MNEHSEDLSSETYGDFSKKKAKNELGSHRDDVLN